MNEYPLVSVIFISFRRLALLKDTLSYFLNNTIYPRESLQLILCDDGSPYEMQNEMREMPFDVFLLSELNQGLGANTNKGLKAAKGKYILQLQDDWILTQKSLYLQYAIVILDMQSTIGLVRFRLGNVYDYAQEMNTHYGTDSFNYKILSKIQSNTILSNFLYSDNPHLKRNDFHTKIGYYQEDCRMEVMELDMCKKFNNSGWDVAIIDSMEEVFFHIGDDASHRNKKTLKNKLHYFMHQNVILKKLLMFYSYFKK